MRKPRRFLISDYNFQFGFYPHPYWILPELGISSSIYTNINGAFTPQALSDALVRAKKMAEKQLLALIIEEKDHPEPFKNLHKSTLPQSEMLPISKVAKALHLSQSAVRTLIDHKILPSTISHGGHRRVSILDVLTYKKKLETKSDCPTPSQPIEPKTKPIFLRISEAAALLEISTTTLWRKYSSGVISGHSFGKEVRFLHTEIEAYKFTKIVIKNHDQLISTT